jgi:hypothetical protein
MWRIAVAVVVSETVELEPGWFGEVGIQALEDQQPAFQSGAVGAGLNLSSFSRSERACSS